MGKSKDHIAENFFIKTYGKKPENQIISDIKRRIYGLISYQTNNEKEKFKDSKKCLRIYENKIITENRLSHILARKSQSGNTWQKFGIEDFKKHLFYKLKGGTGFEMIIAEALMRQNSENYHFLSNSEMDMQNKIDMISRVRNHKNGKMESISFGTQITLAPKNSKTYNQKFEDLKEKTDFFQNSENRDKIAEKFGRIYNVDIPCLFSVENKISKIFTKSDDLLVNKFVLWRKDNFQKDGLIDYFQKSDRIDFENIAKMINEAQKYILSKNFLEKINENFDFSEIQNQYYKRNFSYNKDEKILKTELLKDDELLASLIFFLNENNFENLKK